MCLHHCPSTGQGCRRTPGDHCHTGARCVTLQTTNRQEERDTPSVNNMFTAHKQSKQHVYCTHTTRQEGNTTQPSVQGREKTPLTDLLVPHGGAQVCILICQRDRTSSAQTRVRRLRGAKQNIIHSDTSTEAQRGQTEHHTLRHEYGGSEGPVHTCYFRFIHGESSCDVSAAPSINQQSVEYETLLIPFSRLTHSQVLLGH